MVVSGAIGRSVSTPPAHFDELSILGENTAGEFSERTPFTLSTLKLDGLPFQPAKLTDLAGGDRKANAKIVQSLLSAKERGARREAVLLNAAAAFCVANQAKSLQQGWELAGEVIDSGQAERKLQELRQ